MIKSGIFIFIIENNSQFERANSSRSLLSKENNTIFSNDSTTTSKKRIGMSGDKTRRDIELKEKVNKLENTVFLLQKKLNNECI